MVNGKVDTSPKPFQLQPWWAGSSSYSIVKKTMELIVGKKCTCRYRFKKFLHQMLLWRYCCLLIPRKTKFVPILQGQSASLFQPVKLLLAHASYRIVAEENMS